MIHIEVIRKHGEYGFEAADMTGHKVRLDTSPDSGGENYGVRPMQMLLMGLGGCSGIDVVSILKKQRQTLRDLKIIIEGEREKGKEPSLWVRVHMKFELSGRIDLQKARRACELSIEKYCSVAATLMKAGCKLTWDVNVEHTE